jgi:hypothetical protein
MFNSKAFCVILLLTTLGLGASLYFQVQEMMEYDLLTKLDKQYLSGTFSGGGTAAEPVKDDEAAKEDADATKKEAADTAKNDDKK